MLSLVAFVMFVNYVDRGTLAIAAPAIQKTWNLDAGALGVLFSAFAWTYLLCIPFAGLLLDKLGPRVTLGAGIAGWSLATVMTGLTQSFWQIVGCRMGLGIFESPGIPTNMRCVSVWFPDSQRALAIGLYTAMQPVALAVMVPVATWIMSIAGWRTIFYSTGALGLLAAALWYCLYRDPPSSRAVSLEDVPLIRDRGARPDCDPRREQARFHWPQIARLLRERQLIGMFIGQYALMTTLYFFLTWFPLYLARAAGPTLQQSRGYASLPFLLAVCGALIGGKWSDWMVASGKSLGTARKFPIVLGLLLGLAMVGATCTTNIKLITALMSLAFFGQSIASPVAAALLTDIAPERAIGVTGALLTFSANLGSALSPIIIGFGVQHFGGFALGLIYVSAVSAIGAAAYVFVVGEVKRIKLSSDSGP
jgi:MFS transporter, ACS family, D-galactonate transporter